LSRYLLDVNVLLKIVWPDLEHHFKARSWFLNVGKDSFATNPLTQAGFVRISCSPRVLPKPASMEESFELLTQFTQLSGHAFWPMQFGLRETTAFCASRLFGPNQLTDAYLLGQAIELGAVLATFDESVEQLAGPKYAGNVLQLR
jgi:toxin-antitoxin system PIN domain toxin